MEYYYTDGITNFGPFSLEQLKEKHITAATKVWYTGLSGWTTAGELPELAVLFDPNAAFTPAPPLPGVSAFSSGPLMAPKTWFAEAILVTLFCCQPFGVVGIVYAALVESAIASGNFPEAQRLSKQAAKWTKIAFFSGLAFMIIFGLFYATMLMTVLKNVPNLQSL